MAYTKTNWVNGGAPAINASNLNKMEQGILDGQDIVESGSNANGSYVRFGDGTQICWTTGPATDVTLANGNVFSTVPIEKALPATFISEPTCYGSGSVARWYAMSSTTSVVSYRVFAPTSSTGQAVTPIVAIGRWKV